MKKKILVIGSGGREHALAWKLSQSRNAGKIFVAPGNGGTKEIGTNVPINANEIGHLVDFAKKNWIDIAIVGPDNTLADGVVDIFQAHGLKIFGPSKAAAQIEWSKSFAKEKMVEKNIPTAKYKVFKEYEKALDYAVEMGLPVVIKASGLALGKGVYICHSSEEVHSALKEIFVDRKYGSAGDEVIVEEYLEGAEASLHGFSDGKTVKMFPVCQDHKPIGEGNIGPNTGGMGIVPVFFTPMEIMQAKSRIVDPMIFMLRKSETPFRGVIYPGVMLTSKGIRVLEFNARFGDPETQYYMRILKTDLLDIIEACIEGRLSKTEIEWDNTPCVCVIISSGGYPGSYEKGFPIFGIEKAEKIPGVIVFHSGTTFEEETLKTSGGRVLSITAVGKTVEEALQKAYNAVGLIYFKNMYFRRDIGSQSAKRV